MPLLPGGHVPGVEGASATAASTFGLAIAFGVRRSATVDDVNDIGATRLPWRAVAGSLAIVLIAAAAAAEEPLLRRFRHLSVEDGLCHGSVYAVVQDRAGFMWFGTDGGVDRFDGYAFKHFGVTSPGGNGISAPGVACLTEGSAGGIWIGTWGGGLDRYDPETGRFSSFAHFAADASTLSDDRVAVVYQDSRGRLWVGTYRGLNLLDRTRGAFIRFLHAEDGPGSVAHNRIWSVCEDGAGRLLVGTEGGLDVLDPASGAFTSLWPGESAGQAIASHRVRTMMRDGEGVVWVGAQIGLLRLESGAGRPAPVAGPDGAAPLLAGETVTALFEDHAGDVWIGTQRSGLARWDRESGGLERFQTDPVDRHALSLEDVRAIWEDSSHLLWVATRGGGVNVLDLKPPKFRLVGAGPASDGGPSVRVVQSVLEGRDGAVWVGTDHGLTRLGRDGRTEDFTHDERRAGSLAGDSVQALMQDRLDRLWVGTTNGLDRLDPGGRSFVHYRHDPADSGSLSDDRIQAILETADGELWVGTRDGLNLLDPVIGSCVRYAAAPAEPGGLADAFIRALLEGRDGSLWVGTEIGGVHRLDRRTGCFTRYQHDPADQMSLSNNRVTSMFEDEAGSIWVGTVWGLNRIDPRTGRVDRLLEEDGLPSSAVGAILGDDRGQLWISAARGLFRFDPATRQVRVFSTSDGLQGPIFSRGACARGDSGRFYFGGLSGLNSFDPDAVRDSQRRPPVVLTGFGVANRKFELDRPVDRCERIELSHRESSFHFEFAALDFTSPAHNQYAYKLEGFDAEWNLVGNLRRASYTNVPPGEHVFRVRASNSDGVWNEEGTSIRVIIAPPWWGTLWFRLLAVAVVAGLAFALHQVRLRAVRRRAEGLGRLVEERTAELGMANQQLRRLADRDGLTDLVNHRHFFDLLDGEWRRAFRSGESLSLVMIDIDYFKPYNDALGHLAGDQCLQKVAAAISAVPRRPGDVVARYGGDEFIVLLGGTEEEGAMRVGELVREAVEALGLHHPSAECGSVVTVSVGVSSVLPAAEGETPSRPVGAADAALYRAKAAGRNCVTS